MATTHTVSHLDLLRIVMLEEGYAAQIPAGIALALQQVLHHCAACRRSFTVAPLFDCRGRETGWQARINGGVQGRRGLNPWEALAHLGEALEEERYVPPVASQGSTPIARQGT